MATARKSKKKSTAKNDENSVSSFNYTLNDSYWMDSFDKLVANVKKPLRERNIFKKKVRVSYNRDSSFENGGTSSEDEVDGGKMVVVASTPRGLKAAPKNNGAKPKRTLKDNQLKVPGQGGTRRRSSAKSMFFNFISTPANDRKSEKSLDLSVIVSSEGEGSIWKRISFPNISNYLQNKRRFNSSPINGEESRKMLKTPDKEEKKKATKKRQSKRKTEANPRKSEKPRVLFDLVNDDEQDDLPETRRTENFVLKPGKWRKSIANLRRTTGAAAPPKLSVMFAVPEEQAEGAEAQRLTTGSRLSYHPNQHPGRHRKSIYIAPRRDSILEEEEVDGPQMDKSTNELLAHHSDDDRDRGLRKPKSSGHFANANSRNRVAPTKGRSIPTRPLRPPQVDAEFIDLLAEQLSLSCGRQQRRETRTGRIFNDHDDEDDDDADCHPLNDSSVQLLLHSEQGEDVSTGESSGDEEHLPNRDEPVLPLVVVEDLVVGSKFARQLSKSHSVVVEVLDDVSARDSSDIYQLGASAIAVDQKKKKKKTKGGDGDHSLLIEEEEGHSSSSSSGQESSDEDGERYSQAAAAAEGQRRRHGGTKSIAALPESPTRFCFIDGTKQVSVRDTVLRYCEQAEPLRFDDVYSEAVLRQCRKVGEGVYSEVFMYRQEPAQGDAGKAIVLKVIPIEGALIVNGEVQKKFDEILSEIIISKELSDLRYDQRYRTSGFVNVERVRCVKGCYPGYLVDLWELYRDNHGTDNDHPEVFDDQQLFIVLELENAGQDLEAFNFTNAVQGYSAFLQTVLSLAVAESKYEFEHRDLHWGNILLRPTDEKEAHFVIAGQRVTVPTEGVQVTIIDYTLSRMLYKRNYLQFNDLAHDEDLFSATGDYQYEIYRLMRKRLGNCWSNFEPYTNVLWLHYMIDKLINGARYRLKQSKKHKAAIKQMMTLRDEVPDYKSAVDLAKLFQY